MDYLRRLDALSMTNCLNEYGMVRRTCSDLDLLREAGQSRARIDEAAVRFLAPGRALCSLVILLRAVPLRADRVSTDELYVHLGIPDLRQRC